ncbi:MAG: hypothetical protein BMS9Abin11_0553 [Gammaproteobacteria bacterium]|nr:MAG: hypothetical protein BMS9Abin11_0553 [Gammaproteobacteria bacterium]
MKHEDQFSDEYLNAFVDDQLTPEERTQVYEAINNDSELNQRVCELRKLHDLVQMSYERLPPMSSSIDSAPISRRYWAIGIAASLALVLGILLGWGLAGDKPARATIAQITQQTIPGNIVPVISSKDKFLRGKGFASDKKIQVKVLIHLNTGNPGRFKEALNDVRGLMHYYRSKNINARVEVVANGKGLSMLRADTTPFAKEIKQLQAEHKNLRFVACKNTIDRLAREKGIIARLLPGVVVIDSGVVQIMRRQQQGWAYIQV